MAAANAVSPHPAVVAHRLPFPFSSASFWPCALKFSVCDTSLGPAAPEGVAAVAAAGPRITPPPARAHISCTVLHIAVPPAGVATTLWLHGARPSAARHRARALFWAKRPRTLLVGSARADERRLFFVAPLACTRYPPYPQPLSGACGIPCPRRLNPTDGPCKARRGWCCGRLLTTPMHAPGAKAPVQGAGPRAGLRRGRRARQDCPRKSRAPAAPSTLRSALNATTGCDVAAGPRRAAGCEVDCIALRPLFPPSPLLCSMPALLFLKAV